MYYLRSIGPTFTTVTLLANVSYQVFSIASSYWLSAWSSEANMTESDDRAQQYGYLGIYALFGIGQGETIKILFSVTCPGFQVATHNVKSVTACSYQHCDTKYSSIHGHVERCKIHS